MATPQYVSTSTYNQAVAQLQTLTQNIAADQATVQQQTAQIASLQKQITRQQAACASPYGCNPKGPSKACPAGYKAVLKSGYGWVCQETQATQLSNLKTAYQNAMNCQDGMDMSMSQPAVGGLNAWQQAQTALSIAEATCGGSWGIYLQNQSYLILPAARLRYLLSIGAGNIYRTTGSGTRGSLVTQSSSGVSSASSASSGSPSGSSSASGASSGANISTAGVSSVVANLPQSGTNWSGINAATAQRAAAQLQQKYGVPYTVTRTASGSYRITPG